MKSGTHYETSSKAGQENGLLPLRSSVENLGLPIPKFVLPFLIATLLCSAPTHALTTMARDFVCPIDGETFTQTMAGSGFVRGTMLDLRPYGAVASPWPLPVCPTSKFVLYRPDFKADEIAKLKTYVDSPQFQAIREETPYYRVAKLRQYMGDEAELVGYALLQATWEASDPERYARYAKEALESYRTSLSLPSLDREKWASQALIVGELERRLGMFEEARVQFERLKTLELFKSGIYAAIVELQLQLVSARDVRPHQVPQLKK
jgi:hypothetical protein